MPLRKNGTLLGLMNQSFQQSACAMMKLTFQYCTATSAESACWNLNYFFLLQYLHSKTKTTTLHAHKFSSITVG